MNFVWVAAATILAVAAVAAAVICGLRGDFTFTAKEKQTPPPNKPRQEPVFGDGGANRSQNEARKEPQITNAQTSEAEPAAPQGSLELQAFTPPDLPPPPDDLLAAEMCYTVFVFTQAAAHPDIFNPLLEQWAKWRLPRHILLGYNENEKQWRPPQTHATAAANNNEAHSNWLLAVPLADRGGALDESRINQLEASARRFCQSVGARGKFPSVGGSVKNAKLLDVFCNSVDKVVEMHLAGSPSPERAAEAAKICGLVQADGKDLKYAFRQNSETLFSMTVLTRARGEVRRVVFDLDAPNVSNPAQAFDAMIMRLKRTASMLKLNITDPGGEPVGEERMAEMRKQLTVLSAEMKKFGVPPGGSVARLLFS